MRVQRLRRHQLRITLEPSGPDSQQIQPCYEQMWLFLRESQISCSYQSSTTHESASTTRRKVWMSTHSGHPSRCFTPKFKPQATVTLTLSYSDLWTSTCRGSSLFVVTRAAVLLSLPISSPFARSRAFRSPDTGRLFRGRPCWRKRVAPHVRQRTLA